MNDMIEMIHCTEKLVCIYNDKHNHEKFFLGFIRKVAKEKVLFESLDLEGKSDGFIVMNINDIFLIEIENKYINNMIKKCGVMKQNPIDINDEDDLLKQFIQKVFQKETVINIELLNSAMVDIQGKILRVTDKYIEVEALDDEGQYDGKSYCKISDISLIQCKM